MEQGHSASPHAGKIFVTDGGQIVLGKFIGEVRYGGLLIRSLQGQGSFTNAFFSNLKTVNLKTFVCHERI